MSFWNGKKKNTETEKVEAKKQPAPAQGSSQTGLRALGAKAVTAAAIGALACGPLALVVGFASTQVKPVVTQAAVDNSLTPVQQSTGEYAAGFVAAWLSATRDNPSPLAAYIATSSVKQLSVEPWVYRDLTVVSVDVTEDSDLVSVVVAANVEELDMESEDGATIWPRRYFAVTVNATESGLSVIGLPAPVAAPSKADVPVKLAYTESVMATSTAKATVEAFLNAYLAGSGEISRYVTPGTEITALAPAPFQVLEISDLLADSAPSDTPNTGDVVHVLATVDAGSAAGQQLTATYALTLTARDGRWETTSVDFVPLESNAPAAASDTTPTP